MAVTELMIHLKIDLETGAVSVVTPTAGSAGPATPTVAPLSASGWNSGAVVRSLVAHAPSTYYDLWMDFLTRCRLDLDVTAKLPASGNRPYLNFAAPGRRARIAAMSLRTGRIEIYLADPVARVAQWEVHGVKLATNTDSATGLTTPYGVSLKLTTAADVSVALDVLNSALGRSVAKAA